MKYEYNGYMIQITDDEYLIQKTFPNGSYIRHSQTMADSGFEGATLQEKAEAHVDSLIADSEQEQQKQVTFEELQETVEIHEDVINDAILRGVL